jgi:flagellar biosynthesis protein FliP
MAVSSKAALERGPLFKLLQSMRLQPPLLWLLHRLPRFRLLSWLPLVPVAAIGLLCLAPALAWAQSGAGMGGGTGSSGPAGLPLVVAQGAGGTSYSVPIQTLLFFTALSFLPAVLLLMTAFTRIVIVLSLLRQALGTQAAPPNQVIIGLSLFMTFFVMGPAMDKIYTQAWLPYSAGTLAAEPALVEGLKPLREFMLKQTRQSDVALFSKLAKLPAATKAEDLPLTVLVPSFVTSELKSAFQIGFMIFIPFLIIDMIVASVLMSLGMMMLSPVLVALPFKLMLFVLADGWNLLLGSLAASFAT